MFNFKNDDYSAYAMESGMGGGNLSFGSMDEKTVRQGFVKKVFGIVAAQLALTTLVSALFMTSASLQNVVVTNMWLIWLSMGATFGIMIAMMCNQNLLRTYPHNYTLLGAFTFFEAITIGFVCMLSPGKQVLLAAGITTFVTLGLAAYAMQTKYDFTTAGGILYGALLALLVVSVVSIFLPHMRILELAISGFGAFLFACYLVVDIQMLMDGNRVQLDPDDYILGALMLYLDIINLFLYILRFLNEMNRS